MKTTEKPTLAMLYINRYNPATGKVQPRAQVHVAHSTGVISIFLVSMFMFFSQLSAQEKAAGTVILDTASFWRVHYTLKTPVVKKEQGVEKLTFRKAKWLDRDTPVPSEDWAKPEFDDSAWSRFPGVSGGVYSVWGGPNGGDKKVPFLALVCMRGRFEVTDPAKAKGLTLSASYRGGIIVYINGKEIARGNMPDGEIDMNTLAKDYPPDTFTDEDLKALGSNRTKAEDRAKLCSKVEGKITSMNVPAKLLRKGVNVLAIELHRAPYNEKETVKEGKKGKKSVVMNWGNCGLLNVRLEAPGGGVVVPNIARPKGIQVWNSNPLKVDADLDYGDPNEKLQPLRIVGARNGGFSGKVVVGSDQAIKGLGVKASELESKGDGAIPASAVQIRYAKPDHSQSGPNQRRLVPTTCFDGLEEVPPAEVAVRTKKPNRRARNLQSPGVSPSFGAVVPVWVTVNIPADAAPGDYEGKLTITATGVEPVEVPVKVKVCGWKLPDPPDYVTWVDIIQSPESVAMQYNVPIWSDEHFKYLEKSLKLLGRAGNKATYLHLICKTNVGNAETMVRWIKQGDGTYKHDLTPLEKYLNLVVEHQGKPSVICLYVYDYYCNKSKPKADWVAPGIHGKEKEFGAVLVTALGADGKTEEISLPPYDDPKSKELWKPVIDGIRERLKKHGLEKAMAVGISSDFMPDKFIVDLFKEISPGTPWVSQAHPVRGDIYGVPCKYTSGVWSGGTFPKDPSQGRTYGWKRAFSGKRIRPTDFSSPSPSGPVLVHHPRNRWWSFPITSYRLIGEMNITGSQRGFARLGGDFWRVLPGKRGKKPLAARYPETSWRNLDIQSRLLAIGKNGAISTHRLEMLREGVQECEARIFIEKALLDENLRAKLGKELADKCQAVLDDRISLMRMGVSTLGCSSTNSWTSYAYVDNSWWQIAGVMGYYFYIGSGWQERSEKLYSAAAEVAKAIGEK